MPVWRPPGRSRERILAYGPTGVGKTHAAATVIAKALGPDDAAFIIDADNTWSRCLETVGPDLGLKIRAEVFFERRGKVLVAVENTDYAVEDGNIVIYHTEGWEEHEAALKAALGAADRDDWVVVDSVTWLWDDILPWYIEKVHGEELPQFLMEARINQVKNGRAGAASGATVQEEFVIEWQFVNPRWNKSIAGPLANAKCHVWVTAEAKPMRTDGRVDQQVRQLYENVGWVPATQKRMGHQVQTVIFFSVNKKGEYHFTIVKDRGREKVKDQPWDDMFVEYIRKIAGWKPARPNKGASE